jgi:hypothetical protein
MTRTSFVIGAAALAACGKSGSSEQAAPAKAPPPAHAVVSAKQLPGVPLHADVGDGWKIEEDHVTPGGAARISTEDSEVAVINDGVGGVKKMTLEDEKKLASGTPQEVNEATLPDGWLWSYMQTPAMLPYHATVYRSFGGDSYRCVVTTTTAAAQVEGITICRSLRP